MSCLSDGFLLSILKYFSVMMTGERDFTAELKLKFQKEFFLMKINLCLALLLLTVLCLQFAGPGCKTIKFLVG